MYRRTLEARPPHPAVARMRLTHAPAIPPLPLTLVRGNRSRPHLTSILLRTVSGGSADHGKIRSLQILTGGSPRLMAIVAHFGGKLSFPALMSDLFDLVDAHTEYFKRHIEDLPPQERRVFVALADLWKPATTREIADRARIATSQCSAQLQRLVARGAVAVDGGTPRRKQYYLVERMYNIYYLLQRGDPGASRRGVAAIHGVVLLRAGVVVDRRLHDRRRLTDPTTKPDVSCRSLQSVLALPDLADYRGELELLAQGAASLAGLMARSGEAFDRRDYAEAVRCCDMLLGLLRETDVPVPMSFLAVPMMNKANALCHLDRCDEALALVEETVDGFARNPSDNVDGLAEKALLRRAVMLWRLGRHADALAALDEVWHRYRVGSTPAGAELAASALVRKARLLGELQRSAEALLVYDKVVGQFGASTVPKIAEYVAVALLRKGDLLRAQGRNTAALDAYRDVAGRFGKHDMPALAARVAAARVNEGQILETLNRFAGRPCGLRRHSAPLRFVYGVGIEGRGSRGAGHQGQCAVGEESTRRRPGRLCSQPPHPAGHESGNGRSTFRRRARLRGRRDRVLCLPGTRTRTGANSIIVRRATSAAACNGTAAGVRAQSPRVP